MSIEDDLKEWLKDCSRLVILGIGNPLRGDDALGLEILKRLKGKLPKNVKVINGGATPENFVGKIRRFNPSHVLLIDATRFNGKPGEARLISPSQISGAVISTHTMPLYILANLINKSTGARILLLGIEPKYLNLGEKISPEIKEAIEKSAKLIINVVSKISHKPCFA
ncbi:MAG: hydrogenase maturation peptidase HycI [Candidatus Bathyarchaeia archaeon]